jgi:ABC-2 type transport system ATP-binding protein
MSNQSAVTVERVSKRFRLYHERGNSLKERFVKRGQARYEDLWALNDVSFDVAEGETIGILGHNGSGKSTLLKCVCGVLQPTAGQVVVRGQLAGLLELGAGFQPELSGRDNIYLNGSMLGLSRREVDKVFDEIVEFSELEQFIDNQVKFYSSGMYVRLGFAVAVSVQPDVLVVDEVLAVGDERFQRKCIERIREFKEQGRTIIVVTHSADQIKSICDRAVVLSHGHMLGIGTPGHAIQIFRDSLLTEEALRPHEEVVTVQVGGIKVREISCTHPGAAAHLPFRPGDPVEITIAYHADEPVQEAVFGIEVHSPAGYLILSISTRDLGERFDLESGHGEFCFQFDSWPFLDDELRISGGISSRLGGVVYDWREDAARLKTVYEGRSAGLVTVPVKASLRRAII